MRILLVNPRRRGYIVNFFFKIRKKYNFKIYLIDTDKFVHSFISVTENKNETIAYCNYYDLKISSIIKKNNVMGYQFYPEKIIKNGLRFLEYFCDSDL